MDNILPAQKQRIMMPGDIFDRQTQLLAWAFNEDKLDIGGIDEMTPGIQSVQHQMVTLSPDAITVKATFTEDGYSVWVLYDPDMIKIYNKEHIGSTQENCGQLLELVYNCGRHIPGSPFKNFVYFTLD